MKYRIEIWHDPTEHYPGGWVAEDEWFDSVSEAEDMCEIESHEDYLAGHDLSFVYRIADENGETAAMNYIIMK